MREQKYRLPYVDNVTAVLITLVINVAVTFIFFWPDGVDFPGVIQDTVICVVITVVINMLVVSTSLKRMRAKGVMPTQVPESRLMQRLPKNPAALGLVYILFFCLVTVGLNALVLWFFGMETMSFIPWITYKLIYATVLTIKVVEYCIFRFVQPDWAQAQTDDAVDAAEHTDVELKQVKDPLPKISVFSAMFASVTSSIAMNIIIGTITGGVFVAAESMVVISPNTIEGMPTTGFVFGFITGFLTTNAIFKAVNNSILSEPKGDGSCGAEPKGDGSCGAEPKGDGSCGAPFSAPQEPSPFGSAPQEPSPFGSWMPKARVPFTLLMCAAVMAFSMVMLPFIMWLFGLSILNFYQYTIFMVIYSSLLSKPLSYVVTQRLTQPDYILYILEKHKAQEKSES